MSHWRRRGSAVGAEDGLVERCKTARSNITCHPAGEKLTRNPAAKCLALSLREENIQSRALASGIARGSACDVAAWTPAPTREREPRGIQPCPRPARLPKSSA